MPGVTHPSGVKRPSARLPKSAISGRRKPTGPIKPPHRHSGFAAGVDPGGVHVTHDAKGHMHIEARPHRGGLLMAISVAGWLIPLLGIAAYTMGKSDLKHIHLGAMDRSGESATKIATYMGLASTILYCAAVVVVGGTILALQIAFGG